MSTPVKPTCWKPLRRIVADPFWLLIIAVVACLVPFSDKAVHIDDPLFLWVARRIQTHPLDPYGFSVNWNITQMPMAAVDQNPPLASYYLAQIGRWFGWGERAAHIGLLLPAIAAILGTYYLARQLGSNPMFAGLTVLVTPAFLVSSTTMMCDTTMTAFLVWAIVFWIDGMQRDSHGSLLVSGLLMAAALLTKYFAIVLPGLLLAYSAIKKRRLGWWAAYLLIPVAAAIVYDCVTRAAYGKGVLLYAIAFAPRVRQSGGASVWTRTLIGLAFAGGCCAPVLFLAPFLWSRRTWLGLAGGATAVALLAYFSARIGTHALPSAGPAHWLIPLQYGLFVMGGASLFGLVVTEWGRTRDAESALLALWIIGTFAFATYFNWAITGRALLPMMPALAILLARRVACRRPSSQSGARRLYTALGALIPAAVLALSAAHSDYRLANSARTAARAIFKKFGGQGPVWFAGHWGFQYYMESYGCKPIDLFNLTIPAGAFVVLPENNTDVNALPLENLKPFGWVDLHVCRWLSTMRPESAAGFYADLWGPLPFAFGPVRNERYYVFRF